MRERKRVSMGVRVSMSMRVRVSVRVSAVRAPHPSVKGQPRPGGEVLRCVCVCVCERESAGECGGKS